MKENTVQIRQPHFPFLQENGEAVYGYDQEWYQTEWQRRAGCGPTTSAFLSDYILCRDGILDASQRAGQKDCLDSMERLWNYVTPSRGGLYKTRWLYEGLQQYLDDCRPGLYEVRMLSVYPFHIARPTVRETAAFIYDALAEDGPIAFLNRNDGGEPELYTWHWVPLIGMKREAGMYRCTCFDEKKVCHFSLDRWLERTSLGGGFVSVHKK